jgi:hypothetical protein
MLIKITLQHPLLTGQTINGTSHRNRGAAEGSAQYYDQRFQTYAHQAHKTLILRIVAISYGIVLVDYTGKRWHTSGVAVLTVHNEQFSSPPASSLLLETQQHTFILRKLLNALPSDCTLPCIKYTS